MKFKTIISIVVFFALIILVPVIDAPANAKLILRVGGSTTLLPVVTAAAKSFQEQYQSWKQANVKLPNSKILIFVSGGGTGFGINATINGTLEIGLASRKIKNIEKKRLESYQSYLVGRDAVVIATPNNSPLAGLKKNFTKHQLAKIFSGTAKYFSDINPVFPNRQIVLLVRDSGAGSAEMFQKLIMGKLQIAPSALQVPSQGVLLRRLQTNKWVIGYISSGLALKNKTLNVFKLEGVTPSNQSVIDGTYVFTRPLLMIVKGKVSEQAKLFIDFILGRDGQYLLAAHNYVPIVSPK